jgi:hypothetical protein
VTTDGTVLSYPLFGLVHSITTQRRLFLTSFGNHPLLNYSLARMCYFDQKVLACGDWKWGSMRQSCSKARYVGEGCGLKLIWTSQYTDRKCRICCQIEAKRRRICKLEDRIAHWRCEAQLWWASIERAKDDIHDLHRQIKEREIRRPTKQNCLR